MIHFAYIFLILFFSILIELLFGSIGMLMPITAVSIFYITIVYNLKTGICLGFITGLFINTLYGHYLFPAPLSLIIVSILAFIWLHKGVLKNSSLQVIPGITVSLVYSAPPLLISYFAYEQGFMLLFYKLMILLVSTFLGAILLPTMIVILDSINSKIRLNLYQKAKERLIES